MKRKKNQSGLAARLAGGAVGGALAQVLAGTLMKSFSPVIKNVVLVAGGAVLPEVTSMKGVAEAGTGLIAVGAANLAASYIPGVAGTPFSRFNNAIGNNIDPFYQRMINPVDDQAILGQVRGKKKENPVVL